MRAHFIQCDVGRGDPTPPGNLAAAAKPPGGIYAAPTNQSVSFALPLYRGRGNAPPLHGNAFCVWLFRQVCRGRIYASRAVYPSGCISDVTATGGIYAAPTDQSVSFALPLCRGMTRNLPPYFFVCAFGTNSTLFIIFYLLSLISFQIFLYLFI